MSIPTFEAVQAEMAEYAPDCILAFRAKVPAPDPRLSVPEEVAVFTSRKLPGGCMVWGRSQDGWHANYGERAAISLIFDAYMEEITRDR